MTRAFLDSPICANPDEYFVGDPTRPSSDATESGTLALRDQATIECLDTVSVLRVYRKPLAGETWWTPLKSERRLLAQVDALIGLGARALDKVDALAFDPDVPDPNRLFAAAFALSCASGPRWRKVVMSLLLRVAGRTQAEGMAVTEALCLSPNRELIEELRPLTDHANHAVRAAAVRALGYHGVLAEEAWHRALADPEIAVVEAAVTAFLHTYDKEACKRALQPLMETGDEKLMRVVLKAGLTLRSSAAYHCAVKLSERAPAWADCLRCVAMFGRKSDVARIQSLLETQDSAVALDAAGHLGYVDLIPALYGFIERGEKGSPAVLQASQAIWMTTGLSCNTIEQLETTRKNWQQIFTPYERDARYRLGKPLSEMLLAELLNGPVFSRVARQDLYRELLASTLYDAPRFSPYDFIGEQRNSLGNIGRRLECTAQSQNALGPIG
jgi:hypothetical protein